MPEKYSHVITQGSIQAFTTTSSDKEYETKVIARAASVNENTRTLLVRGITRNVDGTLLPGQSARLKLSLSASSDAISLASNALIPSSDGYSVYVSRNQFVQAVPIKIGQRNDGSVVVAEGLVPGDTVITSNLLGLAPGSPVQFVTLK